MLVDDFRCQGRGCECCDGTGQIEVPQRLLDDAVWERKAAMEDAEVFS